MVNDLDSQARYGGFEPDPVRDFSLAPALLLYCQSNLDISLGTPDFFKSHQIVERVFTDI